MTTGAERLVTALADAGVAACFANPGTSEMHLVTALDREPRIRSVLCLFEGVATGAADGYARIAGKPAMTLLHLGSGLTNAGANLHNARRARSPMVNVIGDHATYHLQYDAPLTSDIAALARPNVVWTTTVGSAAEAGGAGAAAAAAARTLQGPVAVILPADSAWTDSEAATAATVAGAPAPAIDVAQAAVAVKAARKPMVLINGTATVEPGLSSAARLDAAGIGVVTDTFLWRQARGAGRFAPRRLAYFAEMALADLDGVDLLVLAGTQPPAAFFAYPGKPSLLVPEGCATLTLCMPGEDAGAALDALADALGAPAKGRVADRVTPPAPAGPLSATDVGVSLTRHLPEAAIVADDGVTAGLPIFSLTTGAAPHDWLFLTGGAIGIGMPLAVGAAVAAPSRKVVCLSGDGAGMYTNQALWTMARERLDVLTIVFANRSYRILNIEMARTGAGNPGPTASAMLSLDNPPIDWVRLAEAQGVPAARCETAEHFDALFARMVTDKGPGLIEAVV
ncbi:MAG: acetolactate synthase large subunit [Hyphomonadaceae bacterium]|nr:acetolactate synthase large subunit [Hyphomonadaceae bacterium]